jgi:hypothetical protein
MLDVSLMLLFSGNLLRSGSHSLASWGFHNPKFLFEDSIIDRTRIWEVEAQRRFQDCSNGNRNAQNSPEDGLC